MNALRVALVASIVLLFDVLPVSAAYWVSAEYHASATYSDGIPYEDDQTLMSQTYIGGSYTKTGSYGNYGSTSFTVDIFAGAVDVAAHGHGVEWDANRFATGTGIMPDAVFSDRIVFTIPAGTYPDGLYATLRGRTVGSVSSTVGAGARCRCYVTFGGEIYDTGLLESGIDVATTVPVDESWVLVQEIVAPGTTFPHLTERNHTLLAGFYDTRAWSVELNLGDGNWVTGDGDVSFDGGLRVTSFVANAPMTWVSDSGVFAGGLAAAPETPITRGPVLRQNAPNPFNPATIIGWELDAAGPIDLRVHDLAGRLVRTLVVGERSPAGSGEIRWDGCDDRGRAVAAGVYLYRLRAGDAVVSRRMTMVR
ncbi:MAG: hypothetical protein GY838_05050 [bacterium]|nr:hypothetical protein [bacterium]